MINIDLASSGEACSVSCSLDDYDLVHDLIDKISSGYSSNVDVEYCNNIDIDSWKVIKDSYRKQEKMRIFIPSDIKEVTNSFFEGMVTQYKEKDHRESFQGSIESSAKMKTKATTSTDNEILNANRLIRDLQADDGIDANVKKKFKEPDFKLNIPHKNNDEGYVPSNIIKIQERIKIDKNYIEEQSSSRVLDSKESYENFIH